MENSITDSCTVKASLPGQMASSMRVSLAIIGLRVVGNIDGLMEVIMKERLGMDCVMDMVNILLMMLFMKESGLKAKSMEGEKLFLRVAVFLRVHSKMI